MSFNPVPPNTTVQQDLTMSGQRRINLLWECTQSVIAVAVVIANLIVGVHVGLGYSGPAAASPTVPPVLTNALFLIIGFYFARTNHAAIGGIGPKPWQDYEGR